MTKRRTAKREARKLRSGWCPVSELICQQTPRILWKNLERSLWNSCMHSTICAWTNHSWEKECGPLRKMWQLLNLISKSLRGGGKIWKTEWLRTFKTLTTGLIRMTSAILISPKEPKTLRNKSTIESRTMMHRLRILWPQTKSKMGWLPIYKRMRRTCKNRLMILICWMIGDLTRSLLNC